MSPAVFADDKALEAATAAAKKQHPTDSVAVKTEVAAWRKAHVRPGATVAQVADHIEHVRKIAGVDHVGIGSDFDGITETVDGPRGRLDLPGDLRRAGAPRLDATRISPSWRTATCCAF